jgi:lactate permease
MGRFGGGDHTGSGTDQAQPEYLGTAPLPVGFGLVALVISGGGKLVRRLWPAALAAGTVLAGGEWLFSQLPGVELAGALASVPTIVLLAAWGHLVAR